MLKAIEGGALGADEKDPLGVNEGVTSGGTKGSDEGTTLEAGV